MSGLKAIRRRLVSVTNTKQITRAMKLVSAAKLRRAQDSAVSGRDFSARLDRIVGELVGDLPPDFVHPLLQTRETITKRRIVMISGERGLCGAYNTNILKGVREEIAKGETEYDIVPLGRRASSAAKKAGWEIAQELEGLPENASQWPVSDLVRKMVADFESGAIDEVVIYFTKFNSAVSQVVTREVLLPFAGVDTESKAADEAMPVSYDPEAEKIISELIPVLVSTRFKQAGLESKASEHAARMTAMDSATNNANELTDRLRLFYNRARQSTITTELIDIVGGAEATK